MTFEKNRRCLPTALLESMYIRLRRGLGTLAVPSLKSVIRFAKEVLRNTVCQQQQGDSAEKRAPNLYM